MLNHTLIPVPREKVFRREVEIIGGKDKPAQSGPLCRPGSLVWPDTGRQQVHRPGHPVLLRPPPAARSLLPSGDNGNRLKLVT